jgi:AraC-like DNA-binding protein
MCDLGINVDDYNPKILYIFEKKFTDGQSIKMHTHDFLSIIYILSGTCTYTIKDIPYKVKKGDILILNPGVPHGKILPNPGEVIEFHAGFENLNLKYLPKDNLISETATPILTSPKYEPDFLKCCNDILSEQSKNEPGSELFLKSLGMKLIAILLRATFENRTNQEKGVINFEVYDKSIIVNTITEFINENYMKELSLDIISQNMYLSPAYISKLFKEETGESPINYLIKVRLSKAEEYLKDSNFSIKEIAHAVGYEDAYHFSKLFKKYYGYPPSSVKMSRNKD